MYAQLKKKYGQNFLIDKNIINKICNLIPNDFLNILEIGPGDGRLTENILKFNPKKLEIIEIDPNLIPILNIKFQNLQNIKIINKYKEVRGPYSSDSAFKKIEKKTLFISMYHDQALIPFKILNNKGVNLTLGLNYRRLSPAHGTARDIRLKNIADTASYVSCMNF